MAKPKRYPVRIVQLQDRSNVQLRCGFVYALAVHHYPRSPKFIWQIYEPEGNEHFVGTRADVVRDLRRRNEAFCKRVGVDTTP